MFFAFIVSVYDYLILIHDRQFQISKISQIALFQVAIKIIDKTQLNPSSLQKVLHTLYLVSSLLYVLT